MGVLDSNNMTLLDLAKLTNPDGSAAVVAEILNQTNEILDDVSFIRGNLDTGHRATVRTSLPRPTWVGPNGRVQPTKSTTGQVTFGAGHIMDYTEVDKKVLDLAENPEAARLSEDRATIEGIGQELAQTIFTGNENTDYEEFTGFYQYYNDLSGESADNIIDAGGTAGSTLASISIIGWGENTISAFVPKNAPAGVQVEDLGFETSEKLEGLKRVARTEVSLYAGLMVKDWRYGVRIANIDRENLKADASSGPNLPNLIFEGLERMQSLNGVTPIIYMDRQLREKFRQQLASSVQQSTLTFEDVGGRRTAFFQETPIRRVDRLAIDETRVT